MKENYTYPLNPEWSTEELIAVMNMWDMVEKAYEKKATAQEVLTAYKAFKSVVKSIGEERVLGREFEEVTGYSMYHVVKVAKHQKEGLLNKKEFSK